jgi:hypothetical protein
VSLENPPSLPTWLLRTFGSGPTVEVLLGDLSEEYQSRRSARWFWRQALVGVAVCFISEVRAHKFITIRAVLAGLVLLNVLGLAVAPVVTSLTEWVKGYVPWWLYMQWQLYGLVAASTWFFAAILVGWTVAALHRRTRTLAVLAVLAAVTPFMLIDERLFFLVENTLTHSRFLPYLVVHVLHDISIVLGVSIGGLLLSPQQIGRREAIS